jgi:hypothetical protein
MLDREAAGRIGLRCAQRAIWAQVRCRHLARRLADDAESQAGLRLALGLAGSYREEKACWPEWAYWQGIYACRDVTNRRRARTARDALARKHLVFGAMHEGDPDYEALLVGEDPPPDWEARERFLSWIPRWFDPVDVDLLWRSYAGPGLVDAARHYGRTISWASIHRKDALRVLRGDIPSWHLSFRDRRRLA